MTSIAAGQPLEPRLVIAGGGSLPPVVFEHFLQLAGPTPQLVYIPTASRSEINVDKIRELWTARGFGAVHVMHTRDRNVANSAKFLAPLKTASAVWFGGGSQTLIAEAYVGTKFESELYALQKRGGVIGGSSAGAAIQSKRMIASGKLKPVIGSGFDLLPGSIVDQHFIPRGRLPRLIAAVEQANNGQSKSPIIGYGIDEGTALIVTGQTATVVGVSYVLRVQVAAEGRTPIEAFASGSKIILPQK